MGRGRFRGETRPAKLPVRGNVVVSVPPNQARPGGLTGPLVGWIRAWNLPRQVGSRGKSSSPACILRGKGWDRSCEPNVSELVALITISYNSTTASLSPASRRRRQRQPEPPVLNRWMRARGSDGANNWTE